MMKKYKIGDLGKIITGKTPSTAKKDYYGYEYPFITPTDITDSIYVNPASFLSSKGAQLLKNIKLPAKSICFTCIASIGKICITKEESFTNQQINSIIVDEDIFDYRYVYYLLRNYTDQIKAMATGAATPIVNKSKFSDLDIIVHPLEKQRYIANIIFSYDNLIENNLNQIKLLEEAAMRLYQEWFVNLRFPGYETTKIVDGVPQEWTKRTIKEIGEVITGKTPSTTVSDYYGGTIPFVKIPDMHGLIYPLITETTLTHKGANTQKNKYLPPKSIMVSCIATVGLVCIAHEVCQTNQQINSIILNDDRYLYYTFFKMKGIKSLLEGVGSNGATMTNVNKSKFENIELLLPENDILIKFNEKVKPIFDCILANSKQNSRLVEARDKLLPKLMNGEIEV